MADVQPIFSITTSLTVCKCDKNNWKHDECACSQKQYRIHIAHVSSMPLMNAQDLGQEPVHNVELDLNRDRQRFMAAVTDQHRRLKVYFAHASRSSLNIVAGLGAMIVHFSGHGKRLSGLQIEHDRDKAGLGFFMPGDEIARLFSLERSRLPKLVFLSACRSENVGKLLRDAGVPHVICVDAWVNVSDYVAICFTNIFYSQLLAPGDQTVAVAFGQAMRLSMADMRCSAICLKRHMDNPSHPPHPPFKLLESLEAANSTPIQAYLSQVGYGSGEVQEFQSASLPRGLLPVDDRILRRSKETYDILTFLTQRQPPLKLVSLIGPKGCGKSQLALVVPYTNTAFHFSYLVLRMNL
jgi:hypothetical protein